MKQKLTKRKNEQIYGDFEKSKNLWKKIEIVCKKEMDAGLPERGPCV